MDALQLLVGDHNRVRGLFARFEAAQEADDTRSMQTLAQTILHELDIHTKIEEEIFYPAVREIGGELDELVPEGLQEHHVVDVLAEEIKGLPATDEAWVAKMTVLMENVEHHADEEEEEMFPKVRAAFSAAALEELAELMEARKAALGAPTAADKEHLDVAALQELAREQEIPGRSTMNREELLLTVAPTS